MGLPRRAVGAAAPEWTPAGLPGLVGWWEASFGTYQDAAGTTPAGDGTVVQRWNDRSGNGNHLIQSSYAARAIRFDESYPLLSFDGIDDTYPLPTPSVTAQWYAVLRSPTPTWNTYGGVIEASANVAGGDRVAIFGGGVQFHDDPVIRGAQKNGVALPPGPGPNPTYPHGPIDDFFLLRVDANNPTKVRQLQLASLANQYFLAVDMAALVVLGSDLSPANDLQLRQYFASRYVVGV